MFWSVYVAGFNVHHTGQRLFPQWEYLAPELIADVLILLSITDVLITRVRHNNRVFPAWCLQRQCAACFSCYFFRNCSLRQYLWLKENRREETGKKRMWEDLVLGNWGRMLLPRRGSQPQLPLLWTQFGVSSHVEGVRIRRVFCFNNFLQK